MRRSHGGHTHTLISAAGGSADYLEDENERMTDELKDKIGVLKSLSIDIGAEFKYQDKMLKGMDDEFDRSQGALGRTMSHVLRLAKGGHNYFLFYLLLFSLVVFMILWIIVKYK